MPELATVISSGTVDTELTTAVVRIAATGDLDAEITQAIARILAG